MTVWIPMRQGGRWWANVLSARYNSNTDTSVYLRDIICFARKKDAQAWIDKQNAEMTYPHEYDIVKFESKG